MWPVIRVFFSWPFAETENSSPGHDDGDCCWHAAADLVVRGVNGQRGWSQLARHIFRNINGLDQMLFIQEAKQCKLSS